MNMKFNRLESLQVYPEVKFDPKYAPLEYEYCCTRCDKPLNEDECVYGWPQNEPYCQECIDYLEAMADMREEEDYDREN